MNTNPVHVRKGPYFLCDFDAMAAPLVATWTQDDHELFWLAPSTPPPLTAAKVLNWLNTDVTALLFKRDQVAEPLGYLELNLMPAQTRHLWMGHCVIRPGERGRHLGQIMVALALDEAFLLRRAETVSLVVFPENSPALACYRSVGFVTIGEQSKDFATTGRTHRLLRMSISREAYEQAGSRFGGLQ